MQDPTTTNVEVTYQNSEPERITVTTNRMESEFTYNQTYGFEMDGGTAVLASIEGDGDSYPVQSNEGTRKEAQETVEDLPFVQAVVMFNE
jgi:beta-galactosidase GanA